MKHKVLIVEDTEAYQMIYRHWLENCPHGGFEVIVADNTTDAEFLIKTGNPHCVILDWILDNEDGFVFLHRMKEHQKCPPIIFITCAYTAALKANVMALGAAACFDKLKLDCDQFCLAVLALSRKPTDEKIGCCDDQS